MTQAELIISKFGGISKMARALGRTASTIQGWRERGSIPERNWRSIIIAANKEAIEMGEEDFVAHLKLKEPTDTLCGDAPTA